MRTKNSLGAGLPAQAAVYERYGEALSRYLKRRVRRPEDITDLTQEIFELFVRRKDRNEVIRNPLAYLFRIAFHVVGAALNEERRNPVTFDSQAMTEALSTAPLTSSAEDAEDLAVREDVKAALAKLPKSHLTALLLVEGQGLSSKEAAALSGFTPATIASYVTHARAALKLALDEKDSLT
jgi:RNA polymerase sigma factor (sigma-70 family)